MSYVFGAIGILLWFGMFIGSFSVLIDYELFENRLYDIALSIVGLIICIASLLWALSDSENKPCARYETTFQYNAATKTMMPMRVCAQYGEWVTNK